ncbi:MAG: dipeptidase, partial [Alistipes sp.]|nr:dipeptidase [Candidatus Minthomonas equi]
IYTSISRVPECVKVGNGDIMHYSPSSLFWATNRLAQFAYLLYDRVQPEIKTVYDRIENGCIEQVKGIDAEAIRLLGTEPTAKSRKAAIEYITSYSDTTAQNLLKTWQDLDCYLLVKYMDGNIKIQNPDGSFKNNGHSESICEFPEQPGYSDKWKETVVRDNGLILHVKE